MKARRPLLAAILALLAGVLLACGGPPGPVPSDEPQDGPGDAPTEVVAPTDVAVEALESSVRVTWARDADDGAELVVYRALAQSGGDGVYRSEFQALATLPAGAGTYEDADVVARAGYVYGVAAHLGEARSDIAEQQGPPVAVGGDPATGPAAIALFDVAPQHGPTGLTVDLQWRHDGSAEGTECRIDFGDGTRETIADCAPDGTLRHAYEADAAGALVVRLTTVRGPYLDRAEHGVALGLNPDEDRYVALVTQGQDGLPVAGARRFGGNVATIAIDRFGEVDRWTANLGDDGSAILAEYSAGGDRTPYTLFVMVNTAERYGTVLQRFDGIDAGGTLYLDAVAPELARWTVRPARDGDLLGGAYLLLVDAPSAGELAPPQCCMLLDGSDAHLAHVPPARYGLLVAGLTEDGLAFWVHDELAIDGDTTSEVDPRVRPHGRLNLSYRLWDGSEPDGSSMNIRVHDATFWPDGGFSSSVGTAPEIGFQQTSALLAPGRYRGFATLSADDWHANVQSIEVELVDGDVLARDVGGLLSSSLVVGDDAAGTVRPDGTVRISHVVTDSAGHRVTQVYRSGSPDAEPTFRVFDPAGVLVREISDATLGIAHYTLPADAALGTYRVESTWDVGPFAEAPLIAEGAFEFSE